MKRKFTLSFYLFLLGFFIFYFQFCTISRGTVILQYFESKYETIEKRMPDVFMAGYDGLWIPPTNRADTGNLSVGYDLYDRFDLGNASNPTLYGTEASLRGCTLLAAYGSGAVKNLDEINLMNNKNTISIKPNPKVKEIYKNLQKKFIKMYDHLLGYWTE